MLRAREIFSRSSRFSLANALGGVLSAAAYILIARRLGPHGMGQLGLVQLWLLYAGFARPGILQAGCREILHDVGAGDERNARRTEAAALAGEGLAALAPLAVILLAAALWPDPGGTRILLAYAALQFAATTVYQALDSVQWAWQRYDILQRVNLFVKVGQPVLLIAGLFSLGLPGVLLAPSICAAAAASFYLASPDGIHGFPHWERGETRRLLAVGLPLSLYGSLYWVFRTSDRTMAAAMLSMSELGYFTFAMTFINHGCQWTSDFLNVLQASLFGELGREGKVRPLSGRLQRINLLLLTATGAAAGLAQAGFAPAAALFVPRFLPGAPAFEVLALNLVAITAPLLFYTVLTSTVVNEQWKVAALQLAALAVNVTVGVSLVGRGWGLQGIAWSSVAAQAAAAAGAALLLHPHLFESAPRGEAPRFYVRLLLLCGLALAVTAALRTKPLACPEGGPFWPALAARTAFVAMVWGVVGAVVVRRWRDDIGLTAMV